MTQPDKAEPAKARKPYEPPSIKFEKRIEAYATACTCDESNKSGSGVTAFNATDPDGTCGASNFS